MFRRLTVLTILTVTTSAARAVGPVDSFKEVPVEKLSEKDVSDWGKAALDVQAAKWKHGETEHFVIHFFRNGDKIARRSELFYTEIKEFFGNRPDRLEKRKSQVFAFHDGRDWDKFRSHTTMEWATGVTRGNEFFYLTGTEEGQFDSKGKVQAHEMTHLIFNRFFTGRLPLWLNEGIAEFFGQRKTATVTEFRRQMGAARRFGLQQLFDAKSYPSAKDEVHAFYAEAAIVVDFLSRTADRKALLPRFIDSMLTEHALPKALAIYGYKNLAEFESAYEKYRRRF
jgi:hypothetical protein